LGEAGVEEAGIHRVEDGVQVGDAQMRFVQFDGPA